MYYFLREDIDGLDREIHRVKEEIARSLREMGDSCNESSETWHDNFGYEEGVRQSAMWSRRLSELLLIRRDVSIVDRPKNPDRVTIGTVVRIREVDSQEETTLFVTSFMNFADDQPTESPMRVSYAAPLAKILMGARAGEFRQGLIGSTQKNFKILAVS